MRALIVQHGERERVPGDPGLTAFGRAQARRVASRLAADEVALAVWASPLRRARETAEAVAAPVGLRVRVDERLTERANWDHGPFEEFAAEWEKATADRAYVPPTGDSSAAAADRFLDALGDLAATVDGTVVVVAHGGVTTDVLRTLLGDDEVAARAPDLLADGVPSCAVTTLVGGRGAWVVEAIAER